MDIKLVKELAIRNGSRGLLLAQKYSPEIFLVAGVGGLIATVVLASKATLNLKPVIEDHREKELDIIDSAHQLDEEKDEWIQVRTEQEIQKDVVQLYLNTGIQLTRLYGASVATGLLTIGCFVGQYSILTKRNAGLVAAYSVLQGTFNAYRKAVVADKGVDYDKEKIRQVATAERQRRDESRIEGELETEYYSPYSFFFDEYSLFHKRDAAYNLQFLQNQEQYANARLRAQGHLFLNDVLRSLGIPDTKAGAVTGWVYNPSGNPKKNLGDNYVSFGIDVPKNNSFVNGEEPSVLLTFNVDGVIIDLIG